MYHGRQRRMPVSRCDGWGRRRRTGAEGAQRMGKGRWGVGGLTLSQLLGVGEEGMGGEKLGSGEVPGDDGVAAGAVDGVF